MAHDPSYHTDTARLEALSDGVFAIAITLLIIEIGVPHVEGDQGLAHALRDLWPSYFGYALSFLTIGIMWTNHHGMFKDIERLDHTMVMLNILLLLCISFIPFPTAVLAEYMRDEDNALAATLTYGTAFTLTAVVFNVMWWHASRDRRLIDEHVSDMRVRDRTRRYLPGPLMYAVGLPVAFVSTWAAIGVWVFLAVLYLLPLRD